MRILLHVLLRITTKSIFLPQHDTLSETREDKYIPVFQSEIAPSRFRREQRVESAESRSFPRDGTARRLTIITYDVLQTIINSDGGR